MPRPDAPSAIVWLAVHLPHLALDRITRGLPTARDLPIAVSDGDFRRPAVLDCNPAASRRGIRPGLPLSAALALAGDLHLTDRDKAAETKALQGLAALCYQYSGLVSIRPERAALLVEVGGSRKLFGTPGELARRLDSELSSLGYHARIGTAPTPEAAHLAARQGWHVQQASELRERLRTVSLDNLDFDPAQRGAFSRMGFHTAGEVLRLPRKALARHLGPSAVDYLDRLTGTRPDPQSGWRPPPRFSSSLDLAAEIDNSQGLLFPMGRLVNELCGTLRACDRGIQSAQFRLALRKGGETFHLALQRPSRERSHFMLLLRERLERLHLAQPVRRITLRANRFLTFDGHQDALFDDLCADGVVQAIEPLLERLQARLGPGAVTGVRGVRDHRPEYSWTTRDIHEKADCTPMPYRPPWLFSHPHRCRIEDYRVLAGPERIETGWWDGRDCRRDYFVVQDTDGRTLWAYREYKPSPGWYLQGIFG